MALFKGGPPPDYDVVRCPFKSFHTMRRKILDKHILNCPNNPKNGGKPENENLVCCPFSRVHWYDKKHELRHLNKDCLFAKEKFKNEFLYRNLPDPAASIKANKENVPPPSVSGDGEYGSIEPGKRKAGDHSVSELLAIKRRVFAKVCANGDIALLKSEGSYSWLQQGQTMSDTGSRADSISSGSDTVFFSGHASVADSVELQTDTETASVSTDSRDDDLKLSTIGQSVTSMATCTSGSDTVFFNSIGKADSEATVSKEQGESSGHSLSSITTLSSGSNTVFLSASSGSKSSQAS